jgi:hypothetical protein
MYQDGSGSMFVSVDMSFFVMGCFLVISLLIVYLGGLNGVGLEE